MDTTTKKTLEKSIQTINKNFDYIINESLPSKDLIKLEFDGIKALIEHCESLVLGE